MQFTKLGRTIRRGLNLVIGLPFKRFLYYSGLGKSLFLDKQGRAKIRKMEVYVANGCNLKCLFCSHFNPFRRGVVPADELIASFETWSKKVVPQKLGILGGEPLLHPELERIIAAAHRCWPESRIVLTSNGLLFPNKPDSLLQTLKDAGVQVLLSRHVPTEEGERKFQEIVSRLQKAGVWVTIIPSSGRWKRYYNIDDNGQPQPFESSSEKAWTMCGPNTCFNLTNNKLYRCSILANAALAYEEGVLGENWAVTQTYKPLTADASANEIVEHLFLMRGPLKACSICPETTVVVEAQQIERVQRILRTSEDSQ
ncbi:MAG: radical SAM protein [Thermoguttaceae bacterium]|nr:radical SAM protein [Thermoguttaceae bacterium]